MSEANEPEAGIHCRHLLVCRTLWYDPANPDAGYSLGKVLVHVRPPATHGYGYAEPRLFLYAQCFGTPGEYTVRVKMVGVEFADDGGVTERPVADFGPWDIGLPGENFVEAFGFVLTRVPFEEPGVYEFQMWADGIDGPLAAERIEARNPQ